MRKAEEIVKEMHVGSASAVLSNREAKRAFRLVAYQAPQTLRHSFHLSALATPLRLSLQDLVVPIVHTCLKRAWRAKYLACEYDKASFEKD
jgi:hypothetical protein